MVFHRSIDIQRWVFRCALKSQIESAILTKYGFTARIFLLTGKDSFELSGLEVYLYCPDGYGRTKFTNNAIEKAAGIPATTRNWKTVNRLLGM